MEEFDKLIKIVEDLRGEDGCPWDKQQTQQDFKVFLIEEAYEVLDAVNQKDKELLKEELGDLLLQIVAICQIAKENNEFDIKQVIKEVNHKLIRRHPHVFDKTHTRFKSADQVLKNWESIKQQEKGKSKNFSLPKYMPATLALHILLDKLQRFGVYSCDKHKLIFSIKERIKNLDEEIKDNKNITNLILDLINLVRLCGYDAESLLREKVKELQEILINSS